MLIFVNVQIDYSELDVKASRIIGYLSASMDDFNELSEAFIVFVLWLGRVQIENHEVLAKHLAENIGHVVRVLHVIGNKPFLERVPLLSAILNLFKLVLKGVRVLLELLLNFFWLRKVDLSEPFVRILKQSWLALLLQITKALVDSLIVEALDLLDVLEYVLNLFFLFDVSHSVQ